MSSKPNGFTLVELIITVAVAAILLSVAVPAFFDFIQANRVTASVNNMATGFNYARSEAVKRGNNVSICARQPGSATNCGPNWDDGWLVYFNPGNLTNPANAGDVLRVGDPVPDTITVNEINSDNFFNGLLTYQRLGDIALPSPGAAVQFEIVMRPADCSPGTEFQRRLDVSRVGRVGVRQEVCP